MANKPLLCFTLVCFIITQFGCSKYSQRDISREALTPEESKISEVVTTTGEVYSFGQHSNGNYARFQDSTIVGNLEDGRYVSIPMAQVTRISVMRADVAKSLIWTMGAIAVTGLLVVAIIAATKQSCPFVYSYDGERYVFDGEPYGGAICEALKRIDWCRLEHLKPVSNEYRLLLTNEVDETQYTDEFKLWVVDHRPGLEVVVDSDGKLYTVDKPSSPLRVVDSRGNDVTYWLSVKDQIFWETDLRGRDPNNAADLRDTLYLTFPKPKDKWNGKLVVSGSTTLWGSQILKRMTELRGEEIPVWFNELKSPSALQMLDFWNKREELYHLQVKVQIGNEWATRGDIIGGGPFITEDRIVPLDLSGVDGDTLNILIAPPAGFWQLNWFAVDYSANDTVEFNEIAATRVIGHDGADLLRILDSTDGRYYAAPEKGQTASLVFQAPTQNPGRERAIFAKVSGYYDMHMKAAGPAKRETLNRIALEPGYPTRFALEEFMKWKAELAQSNSLQMEEGR